MGLDITAYRQLSPAANGEGLDEHGEADWSHGFFQIYEQPDFAGREAPVVPGVYRAAAQIGFRAGSYSGYNAWRAALANLAGYNPEDAWAGVVTEKPFIELVNFSDCDGTLGSIVCAKLGKDFADFQARADAHGDDYWREKYAEWRKATEMAADGGAIVFH